MAIFLQGSVCLSLLGSDGSGSVDMYTEYSPDHPEPGTYCHQFNNLTGKIGSIFC